jgi:hypothetical protein
VYYTLEFTASGTKALPPAIGPGTGAGKGSPSLCSAAANTSANSTANGGTGTALDGDAFLVQTIGYDYPAYEISYPNSNGNPAPALLTGSQADITISSSAVCTLDPTLACGSSSEATSLKRRRYLKAPLSNVRFHVVK